MKNLFVIVALLISLNHSLAQSEKELDNQVNLLFGVGQILAGGFNVEGNITHNRFFFDYSHGVNLKSPNELLEEGPDKDQQLSFRIPWTTGFGVGYRFNNWLNLRIEPKAHKFEVFYGEDEWGENSLIRDYTTFTLGLGLYANLKPFKNQKNFLKGIMIAPNLRWWPNVATSLENDEFQYFNSFTSQTETHEARSIGIANSPFFANISIGCSFHRK